MERNLRTKKAIKNFISYAVFEILTFASSLIVGRLILSIYGSEYNGLQNSITQLTALFAVIRSGIWGAARVELFVPLANSDNDKVSAIINSCSKLMSKISLVLLVFVVGLSVIYPYIIKSDINKIEVTIIILLIGCSTLSQYYFGFSYQILLSADQSMYIYTIIQIVSLILSSSFSFILIKVGSSFVVMKLVASILLIIAPIALNIIAKKRYKINPKVKSDVRLLKQRWDAMAHAVAVIINKRKDIILITLFLTLNDVSVYAVYFLVINAILLVFNSISDAFTPAFGNMLAKKENDIFNKMFALYEYFTQIFIIIVFSTVATVLCDFVMLYTKGVEDTNYILPTFAFLSAITGATDCLRTPYYAIVSMAGHYKQTKRGAIIEPIVNILISSLLINIVGINGVLIGSIITGGIRTFEYIIYSARNLLYTKHMRHVLENIATIALLIIAFMLQKHIIDWAKISVNTYSDLLLTTFISILVASIISTIYTIVLKKKEFKYTFNFFKIAIKRFVFKKGEFY